MILYVVLLLVLASFVFMFLGARSWHWGYVILVEAVFLATVGFFILAAETVRINGVLRGQMRKTDKELTEVMAQNDALRSGTSNTSVINSLRNTNPTPTIIPEEAESIASLENLDHELLIAARQRGRVWRNVVPAAPADPNTGTVKVNFLPPPKPAAPAAEAGEPPTPAAAPATPPSPPAGIKSDTVVYVFEDGPVTGGQNAQRRPQYLGAFNVVQSAGTQATLQLAYPLEPGDGEMRRLAASRGPWVLYENMPTDRYEIFAGLNEDQLKRMLPQQSVNEYLRHGKDATADDDPNRKVGLDEEGKPLPPDQAGKAAKTVYQRRLRDYATEFDELIRRLVAMRTDRSAVQRDIEQLTGAQKSGQELQAFRTAEKQKLTKDLAGVTKEREAIEKHLAQLNQLLAKARQLTADAMARNRQLVEQLAARQLGSKPGGASSPTRPAGPLALNATK